MSVYCVRINEKKRWISYNVVRTQQLHGVAVAWSFIIKHFWYLSIGIYWNCYTKSILQFLSFEHKYIQTFSPTMRLCAMDDGSCLSLPISSQWHWIERLKSVEPLICSSPLPVSPQVLKPRISPPWHRLEGCCNWRHIPDSDFQHELLSPPLALK